MSNKITQFFGEIFETFSIEQKNNKITDNSIEEVMFYCKNKKYIKNVNV